MVLILAVLFTYRIFLAHLLPDFVFEPVCPMFDGAIIRPKQAGGDSRGIKEEVEKAHNVMLRVSRFSEWPLLHQEMLGRDINIDRCRNFA